MQSIQLTDELETRLAPLVREKGRSVSEYAIDMLNAVVDLVETASPASHFRGKNMQTDTEQTISHQTNTKYDEFNFDLKRMDYMLDTDFEPIPSDVKTLEEFDKWLAEA